MEILPRLTTTHCIRIFWNPCRNPDAQISLQLLGSENIVPWAYA
jgi:hypothetical protein